MRKQLLRVGLLYKIKAIEDTVKHQEEFNNMLPSKILFVIMVQAEFSPVNCPVLPPTRLIVLVKCLLMNVKFV